MIYIFNMCHDQESAVFPENHNCRFDIYFIQEFERVVNIQYNIVNVDLYNENSSKQRSQQNSRASLSNTQQCFFTE